MPGGRPHSRKRVRTPPQPGPGEHVKVHGVRGDARVRRLADRVQIRVGSTLLSMTEAEALDLADRLVDVLETGDHDD